MCRQPSGSVDTVLEGARGSVSSRSLGEGSRCDPGYLNTEGSDDSLSSQGSQETHRRASGGVGIRTLSLNQSSTTFTCFIQTEGAWGGAICMSHLSGSQLGVILPLQGHLTMSADIFDCHNLGWVAGSGDRYWHLAG